MRLIHLDETGKSDVKTEPYAIVAGTIIEPDRHYNAIEAYLHHLVGEYVPKDRLDDFICFQAKELFNGGKVFRRPHWTIERARPLIKKILKIPRRFRIPIVYGCARRAEFGDGKVASQKNRDELAHAMAFVLCLMRANAWVRDRAREGEVAMVVVEDHPTMRAILKRAHEFIRYPPANILGNVEYLRYLPIERIIESVLFAKKHESSLLQIADMCNYVIRRTIAKKPHAGDFYELIRPQIHWRPSIENDPLRCSYEPPHPHWVEIAINMDGQTVRGEVADRDVDPPPEGWGIRVSSDESIKD